MTLTELVEEVVVAQKVYNEAYTAACDARAVAHTATEAESLAAEQLDKVRHALHQAIRTEASKREQA